MTKEKSKHYKHEIRKTSDLIPYINNSRTHDDNQIRQIASSINEFGFTNPVLIDEKYVDVIILRWQEFTGKQATHIESGKTYEELKGDRHE